MGRRLSTRVATFGASALLALSMAPAAAFAANVGDTGGLSNAIVAQDGETAQDGYTYLYAALTWNEYWANEGVCASGDDSSSAALDSHGETDKGAFDVVTRATKNHGLHRGSFQSSATIYDKDGNAYDVSHWSDDGKTIYLVDGTSIGWSKGMITKSDKKTAEMDHYVVTGYKYVPVCVSNEDLADFKSKYAVVENDGKLYGGYSELNLKAYDAVAAVDETTNGLKTATKNADGTYSFSAAQAGTGSGLKDVAQKTADMTKIEAVIKSVDADYGSPGAYGDFIRVDLNGEYGDLGSCISAVTWKYFGDTNPADSADAQPLATYGTKFAADNWMHKKLGIQLGLTESARCVLPEGTNGTGYWQLVVRAMGYADTVINVRATEDNLSDDAPGDKTKLEEVLAVAQTKVESDYTAASWAPFKAELDETAELLKKESLTKAEVNEQVGHLTDAMNALVHVFAIADAQYEWIDVSESGASAPDGFAKIGDTGVYYKVAEGSAALTDPLYGMDMDAAVAYSALYKSLTDNAVGEGNYDAITSATGIVANKHYGFLSDLVARTVGSEAVGKTVPEPEKNVLTGAYATVKKLEGDDVAAYVEASILEAAGKELTGAQAALFDGIRLNNNPTVDPATVTNRVKANAETADGSKTAWSYFDPTNLASSKVYGDTSFKIEPVSGDGSDYSWDEYWPEVYAATIADGKGNVAGLAPWVDLYAQAGHNAVEIAIRNGKHAYESQNQAVVDRFAAMYDAATGRLAAGDYTITVYAAGYNPLSYTFSVGAAVPSDDLTSLAIANADFDGKTATVTKYAAEYEPKVSTKKGDAAAGCGENYAQDVAVADGKIALDKMLDAGDYKIAFSDKTVYTFKVSESAATTAADAAASAAKEVLAGVDFTDDAAAEAAIASYDALSNEAQGKIDPETVEKVEAARKALADKRAIASAKVSAKPTYNGKAQTPAVTVIASDGSTVPAAGYDVAYTNNVNAGSATVTVTAKAPYTGSATATFAIAKAANGVKLAKVSKKVKAKKVKKKAQSVAIKKATGAQGAVTYSIAKANKSKKSFKINAKTGKITVKKKTKKGTYKVTVAAKAVGDANYNAGTATAVVTIKVK